METSALKIGQRYAYREKRNTSSPLLKVKLLDIVGRKGKVKVCFEDGPHPGLEEYISTRQLIVPWGQRQALLRDEERAAALDEHARGSYDKALTEAASAVLESTGEPGAWVGERGTAMRESELQRILDRAGVHTEPAKLHPLAYCDRYGDVHLPLEAAVAVAKSFAAAEPQTVVGYLDDQEEELRQKGNMAGERWYHGYLRELSPGYALARQWAGLEQEAEMLRKEIARLRSLASAAAYDLKAAGQERKASRLLRALEGR
jgi:hypothetical protein